jgi:nucleoside-diphosphate-sugar epimerase
MIYNKDQAKFCVDATHAPSGEHWLFNTPTERPFSEGDVISILRDIAPNCDIVRDATPPFGSAFPPNVDGSRARRHIDYKADYTVRAAIAEMIDYYRQNPEQCV